MLGRERWNELFYSSASAVDAEVRDACCSCRIQVDCLVAALERGDPGVWGGTTEAQRRDLKRRGAWRETLVEIRKLTVG